MWKLSTACGQKGYPECSFSFFSPLFFTLEFTHQVPSSPLIPAFWVYSLWSIPPHLWWKHLSFCRVPLLDHPSDHIMALLPSIMWRLSVAHRICPSHGVEDCDLQFYLYLLPLPPPLPYHFVPLEISTFYCHVHLHCLPSTWHSPTLFFLKSQIKCQFPYKVSRISTQN